MEPLTVVLELRSPAQEGSAHADGVVVHPDGRRQAFSGWMALLGVLETFLDPAGTDAVA